MSIESARAFLERIRNDDNFRKQVGEIATPEERLEFIKAEGFDFTKEELDEVQSELGDMELDQVAGGGWGCGYTHEGEGHCGNTHEDYDPCYLGCTQQM